jgi:hypothetical protein|tara:strand:- start:443 stop:1516 length:1074 start_codon:yes stop_codon:yes gene_type:complete
MADKPQAPLSAAPVPILPDGSIRQAQEAFLSLGNPEEEKPKEEEIEASEEVQDVEESTEPEEEALEATDEESEVEEEDSEESEVEEEIVEEEDDTPGLYTVKINGQDQEVTEEELLKGYSRQQDYTRKTQELSEYRKQLDDAGQYYQQEVAKTQEARQQYISSLANAAQLNLASLKEYQNIDWERLKTEDKEEYLTKRDEYREAQSHIQQLQQAQAQENEQQSQEHQQQFNHWAQDEYQKLVKMIPEWGVPEKQKAIAANLRQFANSKGFNDEEVKQLFDHRSIIILMQAHAWENSQKTAKNLKTKKVKKNVKVVKSGKGVEKSASNKAVRHTKMKRLKQSGHVNDAIGLFEDFVDL